MKYPLIPSLVFAALAAGSLRHPAVAEEPASGSAAFGPLFLPLDREKLGLSEEQTRAMHRIAAGMSPRNQKLDAERRERTKALHEVMSERPIDSARALERFQAVLQVENEMKTLQLLSSIAIRSLLTPEQLAKVQPVASPESVPRGGANPGEWREQLQQVREEIRKRTGGSEPPRELVEKLERIEQTARQGRADEAQAQLEAILRHLREESASRRSAEAQRPEDAQTPGAEIEEQMRKIAGEMEQISDPALRERLQQKWRKLREVQERARGSSESKRPTEGAPRVGGEDLEQRMREIGEAAKRTDNPELREQLQGALQGLREAAEAGNREAVEKIMRSVEPMLRRTSESSAPNPARRPEE